MGVVSQIHIKLRSTESSKQAGGCLLIQESLCCMELQSILPCAQEHSTRTYIKLNQVRGQLLHSLMFRFGQVPVLSDEYLLSFAALFGRACGRTWEMDHVNTISQKTGSTKR